MRYKSLGNCDGSMTISAKYIECDAYGGLRLRSQNGEICRSIAHTDRRIIFFENNIFHPMKAIFDTPMTANTDRKFLRRANQTANITDNFMIFFTQSLANSFDPN